jgi:hypothetical protein
LRATAQSGESFFAASGPTNAGRWQRTRPRRRRRQLRLAERRAAEQRSKRRERQIYLGLGVGLLVLAAFTIATVSSSGSGTPATQHATPRPVAAASARPTDASAGERGALAANVRQANQILDTTIEAQVAQLAGVPVVINQWASWCTNCRFEFPFFQPDRVAFVGTAPGRTERLPGFMNAFPLACCRWYLATFLLSSCPPPPSRAPLRTERCCSLSTRPAWRSRSSQPRSRSSE